MLKAIIRNGVAMPLQPFPWEWHEGSEVSVELSAPEPESSLVEMPLDFEDDGSEFESVSEEDMKIIRDSIAEQKRASKECMARRMGLA